MIYISGLSLTPFSRTNPRLSPVTGQPRNAAEFDRQRHAHGGTHRFRQYKMSEAEIKRLSLCQKRLLKMADKLCQKKIEGLA